MLSAVPESSDSEQVVALREERDRFARRLADAEAKLSKQSQAGASDQQASSDLQRRFELAVEEVRELKRTHAELELKLKARGTTAPSAPGGGLNWEAQKQRLLASLEADDDDDEEARQERTSIEGTIRITDEVVAQKDVEIAELRRSLEDRAPQTTNQSVAIADLLDKDEIIRQEREKISAMQAEWREKIGEAEIDISVQRAKLARERAELDEKLRQLQSQQESHAESDIPQNESGKPARGRWLARLGLKDLDDPK